MTRRTPCAKSGRTQVSAFHLRQALGDMTGEEQEMGEVAANIRSGLEQSAKAGQPPVRVETP